MHGGGKDYLESWPVTLWTVHPFCCRFRIWVTDLNLVMSYIAYYQYPTGQENCWEWTVFKKGEELEFRDSIRKGIGFTVDFLKERQDPIPPSTSSYSCNMQIPLPMGKCAWNERSWGAVVLFIAHSRIFALEGGVSQDGVKEVMLHLKGSRQVATQKDSFLGLEVWS